MKKNRFNLSMKRIEIVLACFVLVGSCFGCSSNNESESLDKSLDSSQVTDEFSKPQSEKTEDRSTAENDTAIGLKNIKIDSASANLTDEQKAIVEYFDEDYLDVTDYEFMRRYPNLFQDAQVSVYGAVVKVLSMDNDQYEVVVWVNVVPYGRAYDEESYQQMYGGQYIVLRGKTDSSDWYMEHDILMADGRYTGIETVDIDGTSYTLPCINAYHAYRAYFTYGMFLSSERFDASTVKTVAKAVFGDIEFRRPVLEDFSEETALIMLNTSGVGNYYSIEEAKDSIAMTGEDVGEQFPYYTVELENQSNANFTKFLFSTQRGEIIDAKDPVFSGTIERYVEFSPDFEHLFLFTYDTSLETLKLGYYDKDIHKIWEREFEETTSAVYDYTKNNIYIVVNNQLYVINTETGLDTFSPTYVGARVAVRKFEDSILMVSSGKSEGIVKSNLDGTIQWTANLAADVDDVGGIQLVDGNLIVQYTDANWEDHYAQINYESGEIILNI